MMVYKNFALLAHVDAGKTTVTEQLLYQSGAVRSAGRVDSGTAKTDSLDVERERGISVRAASASVVYGGVKLNIIDTPGHVDFAGEVDRCLGALDFAVLVISAVEGVQSHTDAILRAIREYGLPYMVFINKIDRAGADVDAVLGKLRSKADAPVYIPLSDAVNAGERGCSVRSPGEADETGWRRRLTEILAEYDDGIADAYLSDTPASPEQLNAALADAVGSCRVVPVLCGSALLGIGTRELLDFIAGMMPDSSRKAADGLSAFIYKIEHDKTMGKVAHVRLFGGGLTSRDSVAVNTNGGASEPEKITQIRQFNGAKYADTGAVRAGDIAALCGLSSAKTGGWIGEYAVSEKYRIANPFMSVRVTPSEPSRITETVNALRELAEEEPLLDCRWEKSEREIIISVTGDIQTEIIARLLSDRYGISATFSPPSVIYRETPTRAGYGFEAYTMPKPCWAVVRLYIEPLPRGSGIVWDGGHVSHNRLFYKYQTHIKTSLFTAVAQGPMGWEVTDAKITLADGEHHTIHTHPLDFFVATPMALADGLRNTGTTLLEPMLNVRIEAAAELRGRVITELMKTGGEVGVPVTGVGAFTVEARVPAATSVGLPVKVASLSGGKGFYSQRFDGYEVCPSDRLVVTPRRGCDPLDRAKWILYARGAMTDSD